jgi:hypothetical protein
MRTRYLSTILGFAIVIAATPATAADCRLKMFASVSTEVGADGAMLLPANFGGVRKLLLVDSGAVFHKLRRSVVTELGLTTRESHLVAVVDALNQQNSLVARAPAFSLGQMSPIGVDFMVDGDGLIDDNVQIAGIFSPGIYYRSMDIDLDFVGRKFNLVSHDHCDGQVVYWPNNGVAVVPFQYDSSNHIVFPVKVDGQALRASLNTGASNTVMYTRAARRLGVDVDSGQVRDIGSFGDNSNVRMHEHRFKTLEIEGITVNNPYMHLVPDMRTRMPEGPSTTGGRNETRLGTPRGQAGSDMWLGLSVLRQLHVYIASKERKLYITAGSVPSTPAATAPASQPAAGESGKPAQ